MEKKKKKNGNCKAFCVARKHNKINIIHERALRTVCQDKKSNLQDLLQKDKSLSMHIKNLQYLATEI